VTIKSYPTLNHLFMVGEGTATPAEYERPGKVAEFVLDDIANWIGKSYGVAWWAMLSLNKIDIGRSRFCRDLAFREVGTGVFCGRAWLGVRDDVRNYLVHAA
jgi:hypothetical protein